MVDPALENVSGKYFDGFASTEAVSFAKAPRYTDKDSRFLKVFA
jgi:hypothetical protein